MERDGDDARAGRRSRSSAGKIYEGGNLHDLERALGATGDEVLYVGDHIYGDILRSQEGERLAHRDDHPGARGRGRSPTSRAARTSRAPSTSRTGASGSRTSSASTRRASRTSRASIDARARSKPNGVRRWPRLEAERGAHQARDRAGARPAPQRRRRARRRSSGAIDQRFHPYWGSLLKEENEQSSFGAQVEEYACLYTSRVSNFLSYSPQQYFRSPRDVMAHEIGA